ncbi:DMSO/TMAO reductase YedYZ molybdopterin-dependent catalytic subunit [Pseudonocardia sediminis]|uniref:DMSO/TMAO reductase YedYZ molybdopterin-dependent catalytic subunit n=1 Tax=Pseudonocardia sediminis TaxID=1397368 RepID=A0A4Q7V4S5_PSEST|nr:molybdopterin-dependent oxidoreductase [Pseudonocardia sediminis]RZT88541.1 DMSO/TMAO reductase YedYZ molybdopterin-dependent catalytic subunit [Pseudonocardia sediminis]
MTSTTSPPAPTTPAPARLATGQAAGIGLAATVLGVGAGQLVAGLFSPSSAPLLAVGDRVINLSPQPLVEFATSTFGTADKAVLIAGIVVLLVVVGAVAGLVSRRDERPGSGVLAGLGVVGVAAVATGSSFGPLDLLAPAAALFSAVWAFRRLHRVGLRAGRQREPAAGLTRRRLLAAGSAAGLGGLLAGAAGVGLGSGLSATGGPAASRDAVTRRLATATVTRAPALPPGVDLPDAGVTRFATANADFYRIDTALRVPSLTAESWRLRVHGMVARELDIGFDDLMRRPLVERWVTMTCVSNEVGGDLVSNARFVGVDLRELLLEAGPLPGADQVLSTSTDGWTAGSPTSVLLEPGRGALLAVGMNGEALPREHGFPVRIVVPGLYGYVSATKWLEQIELTTFADRQAYWIDQGWGVLGPIKTGARIDVPGAFASVPAGPVTIAGSAWSQPRGISRVEVRVDGGPWQEASLAATPGGDTWRMWKAVLDLPAGRPTVECRATDADGSTQTDQRADPIPDGATGWPSRRFTVG